MSVTVLGWKHVLKKYCWSILTPFHSNIFRIQQWGQLIPFLKIKGCIKLLEAIIRWLIFFFFNHQVGTSWNKENSINFCVPFVPCLGFLVDCKIPKFKTVSWFNCTQYLVEHDVHIGPCWVPPFASPVWQLHKRELLFLLSHLGGLALQVPFSEIHDPEMTAAGEI